MSQSLDDYQEFCESVFDLMDKHTSRKLLTYADYMAIFGTFFAEICWEAESRCDTEQGAMAIREQAKQNIVEFLDRKERIAELAALCAKRKETVH